jgi:hypothetical protein
LYLEGILPSVDKIVLKTQPAQSPDTNLCDNGFFNALQSGYKKHAPRNARETIHAVFKVWREYPHARINHMWLTLMTNHDQIIKCNGNNTYKIVHMSKEKLDRQGILPTVIQVSGEARQKLEDDAMALDGDNEEPTPEQEAEDQALDQLIEEERGNIPDAITEEQLAGLREDTQEQNVRTHQIMEERTPIQFS